MSISLDAFRSIASGNYNLGSVVIDNSNADGQSSLIKVNAHRWRVSQNKTQITVEQNKDVRTAFYEAIRDYVQGRFGVAESGNYLKDFRNELLGTGKIEQNLTRDQIHTLLNKLDNEKIFKGVEIKGVENLEVQSSGRKQTITDIAGNISNSAKTFAKLSGLTVNAVKRLCANEGDAIKFLVHELAAKAKTDGNDFIDLQTYRTCVANALRQLAGTAETKLTDANLSGHESVKTALAMLKGGFANASIKANPDVASSLYDALQTLLTKGGGASYECKGDLAGLTLTMRKDGMLSVTFAGKTLDLASPVAHYVRRLEEAVAAFSNDEVTNGAPDLKTLQEKVLSNLVSKWDEANANAPVDQTLRQHCRAVATTFLPGRIKELTAQMCTRIPTQKLVELLGSWSNNDNQNLSIQDFKKRYFAPVSSKSVEELETLGCDPLNTLQKNFAELDDVPKAEAMLSNIAFATASKETLVGELKAHFEELCNLTKETVEALTPMEQKVVEVLRQKEGVIGIPRNDDNAGWMSLADEVDKALGEMLGLGHVSKALDAWLGVGMFNGKNPPPSEGVEVLQTLLYNNFDDEVVDGVGVKGILDTPVYNPFRSGISVRDALPEGKKFEELGTVKDGNSPSVYKQIASYVKPENYPFIKGMDDADYSVSGDVFDLLAATITSPEKLRASFPKDRKPSVDGAFAIVHKMVESIYNAAMERASDDGRYPLGADDSVRQKEFNEAVEGLAGILVRPPISLKSRVLTNSLTFEAIDGNLEKGDGCLESFYALLKKLPGPTVSAILKGLCRQLIFMNVDANCNAGGEDEEEKSSALSGFNKKHLNPVYSLMKEWRNKVGDLKGLKTESGYKLERIFTPPEKEVKFGEKNRFDLLDPDRKEKLDEIMGVDINTEFVHKVLPDYLTKIAEKPYLKAKTLARLMKHKTVTPPESDKVMNWVYFEELIEEAGPIMQKYLQGFNLPEGAPDEMKSVFDKLKSNKSGLSDEFVNARLDQIIASSGGRITDIDRPPELIAGATVGVSYKCKVKTSDNPEGELYVIKLTRPDAAERLSEEKTIIDEILSGKTSLKEAHKGRIETIEKEFDLSGEFDGLGLGGVYNGKSKDVASVSALSLVPPDPSFVAMRFVKGNTACKNVKDAKDRSKEFESVNREVDGEFSDVDDLTKWSGKVKLMLDDRKKLLGMRGKLASMAKVWFSEALKGGGFYHRDLHSGNIMVDEKLATMIDFGNFGTLDESMRKNFAKFFSCILVGKGSASSRVKKLMGLVSQLNMGSVRDKDKAAFSKELEAIFKSGTTPEQVFLRIQKTQECLAKYNLKLPSELGNFLLAQTRLQNSIREVNTTLRNLDVALQSAGKNRQRYIDTWPIPESVRKSHINQIGERAKALAKKQTDKLNGGGDFTEFNQNINAIKDHLNDGADPKFVSYESEILNLVKTWS